MNEHSKDKNAYLSRVVFKSRLFDEIARSVELYKNSLNDKDLIENIINIVNRSENND